MFSQIEKKTESKFTSGWRPCWCKQQNTATRCTKHLYYNDN